MSDDQPWLQPLDKSPGTYVLVLATKRPGPLQVGRLGTLMLRFGVYVYVGSAHGPGGIQARVLRHAKRDKRCHWHIDYLTTAPGVDLVEVDFVTDTRRLEDAFAHAFLTVKDSEVPLHGFGASDSAHVAHLVYFAKRPDISSIIGQSVGREVASRLEIRTV